MTHYERVIKNQSHLASTESERPQRISEYLNKSVTTSLFDKKRPARTNAESICFKPKRDDNGIIIYKSEAERETTFYADAVRKLWQKEFDNEELYSELDKI